MIAAMRAWIEAGKPKNAPPLSPKGDPIRKIRLITTDKPAVPVRGGNAERGEMVRVDVFRKANKRGFFEYFLVPIYPHQVADRNAWPAPPNKAIRSDVRDEADWPEITDEFEFLFSLQQRCYVEVETAKGETISGYYLGADRDRASIKVSPTHSTVEFERPRVLTLRRFEKYRVDRLGRLSLVPRETRTWHGVVCT
jgi:CRISPR-associated endonuclease Csn1